MPYGKNRIVQEHARTGITHNLTYLLAHSRLIAMHRATSATGFLITELAMLQTLMGISQEFLTLGTEGRNGER